MSLIAQGYGLPEDRGALDRTSGRATSWRVGAAFSISRSYATWITAQVILYFLLTTALFEALFLSQHFTDIFGDNADEVGSFLDALILTALSAPEVHYVLPVSVLIAVYFVLLRCRERRELIVFAGAGLGIRQFGVFAFLWGIMALTTSLLITGVILPYTSYVYRADLFAFRKEALAAGGAAGQFYSFPQYTVFKWPNAAAKAPALFIYQKRDNNVDRAISANDVEVRKSPRGDSVELLFGDVVALDVPNEVTHSNGMQNDLEDSGSHCLDCAQPNDRVVRIKDYAQSFDLEQLFHLDPRGNYAREWSTLELVGISSSPSGDVSPDARRKELDERLARALLALAAPFCALVALAWTTRLTQALALPIACAAVLGLDVIGLTVARTLAGSGLWPAIAAIVGIFTALIAIMFWQIRVLQPALIKPSLSKT